MAVPKLQAPIVLVHGLLGFNQLKLCGYTLASYFPGIPELLSAAGNRVLVPSVSPTKGVADRAAQLKAFIDQQSPERAGPPHRPQHGRSRRPLHDLPPRHGRARPDADDAGHAAPRQQLRRLGRAAGWSALSSRSSIFRFSAPGLLRPDHREVPANSTSRCPTLPTSATSRSPAGTPTAAGRAVPSPARFVRHAEGPNDGIVSRHSASTAKAARSGTATTSAWSTGPTRPAARPRPDYARLLGVSPTRVSSPVREVSREAWRRLNRRHVPCPVTSEAFPVTNPLQRCIEPQVEFGCLMMLIRCREHSS